jgi:hypothetical protein
MEIMTFPNFEKNEKFIEQFIIHPGYPKTGTTFYQEKIFNNLKEINFIGKKLNNDDEFVHNINKLRDYICNNLSEDLEIERELVLYFKKKANKKKIHLLSSEFFFDVEHNKLGDNFKNYVSIENVCERLFNFFLKFSKSVKIIISTREPNQILHRYYLNRYEHYKKFNIYNYDSFKKFQFENKESFAASLRFEKIFSVLKNNFSSNIFFIKFELLSEKSDPEIKKISEIFKVEKKKIIKLINENENENKSLKFKNEYYATYDTYPNWIYKIKKNINSKYYPIFKNIFNFFFSFLKKKDLIGKADIDNSYFKQTKLFYKNDLIN